MSADILIAASARIRHDVDFQQAYGDDTFLLAVADWLDDEAAQWAINYEATQTPSRGVDQPSAIHCGDPRGAAKSADYHARRALVVARAYLNESA